MNLKKLNLQTICGGVADELFKRELDMIAKNVDDMNTDAEAVRKITLTFTFKPDQDRREIQATVQAKAAHAPVKPMKNTVFCGRIDGKSTILGHDPRQLELDIDNSAKASVSKIAEARQ